VEIPNYRTSGAFLYLVEQLSVLLHLKEEITEVMLHSTIICSSFNGKSTSTFLNFIISKYAPISNIPGAPEEIIFYCTEFCTL
jgi:hypothetical protein